MPKFKGIRFRTSFLALLLSLVVVISSCSTDRSDKSKASDPELEAKVLEIVRKNPQAILDSVQAYQQEQRKLQSDARQKVLQQIKTEPKLIIRGSPVTGATSQKLVLAEFSDFQCPYCAKAHGPVKQFIEKYGDRVTLTYKFLPLVEIHPEALPSAKAAWAAGQQGKFWEYHDALFTQQDKLGESFYVAIANDLKLDMDKFNKDRASEAAKAAIEKDIELARSLGVSSTPSFIFNGAPFSGAMSLSDLEQVLTEVEAKK